MAAHDQRGDADGDAQRAVAQYVPQRGQAPAALGGQGGHEQQAGRQDEEAEEADAHEGRVPAGGLADGGAERGAGDGGEGDAAEDHRGRADGVALGTSRTAIETAMDQNTPCARATMRRAVSSSA